MNVAFASMYGRAADGGPRRFAAGGKFATMLAAVAPFFAVAVAGLQNFLLFGTVEGPGAYHLASWALLVAAVVCATVIAMHVWRGIHHGILSPFRLLLLAVLPCWLLGELTGQYMAMQELRYGGSASAHAEFTTLRLAGQFYAWTLTGSVCFGLAIACFLWRAPGRRIPGFGLAWLSLVPLIGFALWVVLGGWVESAAVRAGFLGYAFISLPFVLGFAGAALGSEEAPHPHREWLLGVPIGTLVGFAAIAATAAGQAMVDAGIALSNAGPDAAALANSTVDRAIGFGYLGLVVAAVPAIAFALRLRALPEWKAYVPVLVVVLLVVALVVVDLVLDRPVRGMAVPYMRRLQLLLAFAVLAPLALWGMLRLMPTANDGIFTKGLQLVVGLFALQAMAMRPGMTVIESYAQSRPSPAEPVAEFLEESLSDAVPPPPSMASGSVEAEVVEMVEIEGDSEGFGVAGGAMGGLTDGVPVPGDVAQATSESAPVGAAPPVPIVVDASSLNAMRTHGSSALTYPEHLRAPGRRMVLVRVHVDTHGEVANLDVIKSSGDPRLDAHVIEAMRRWQFAPWMENGRPVPVVATYPLTFVSN